ncbi:MAG: 3'-5' exonuclease [Bacteroidetes bacterium]|nr:3'-5' exonuclease [Bacteroidota bacterium]
MLNLRRPLVVFDLETTGVSVTHDRIVEICLLKVFPDMREEIRTYRINPGIPIPAGATAVHGISNADVADKPSFKSMAPELHAYLRDCDFGGFNSNKFDFPMLVEEFFRAGIEFDVRACKFIDAQRIYHMKEPRTLSAAYEFYCSRDLENAHSAEADTVATWEIIRAQINKYQDLPQEIEGLHKLTGQDLLADLAGRLVFNDKGEVIFNFGKHKGRTVKDVLLNEPGYYNWMMEGDFPQQTKNVMSRIRLSLKSN